MAKAKISDFRPQQRNANRHTQRGLGMLDKSMADNGFIGAMTSAADGEIFDGSARLETAYDRFGEEVEPIVIDADGTRPIIVRRTDIPSASDPRAKKLAIAANRIAQVDLDWDPELLKAIGEEIDIDISDLFFDNEIENLFEDLEEPEDWEEKEEDEDALSESLENIGKVESRVKLGEIWQLGRHKIACGDSTIEANVRALLGDIKADMVFTDPPYLMDFTGGIHADGSKSFNAKHGKIKNDKMSEADGNNFLDSVNKIIKSFCLGAFYITFYRLGIDRYYESMKRVGLKSRSLIIWHKGNHTLSNSDYMSMYEPMFYGWVEEHNFYGGNNGMDIWEIARTQKNDLHPTMKPVELVEKAIKDGSTQGDSILDLFLGSGTTLIAAQKMEGDRTVYGFELSPDYCEVIIQRYENFTGDTAKLVGTL